MIQNVGLSLGPKWGCNQQQQQSLLGFNPWLWGCVVFWPRRHPETQERWNPCCCWIAKLGLWHTDLLFKNTTHDGSSSRSPRSSMDLRDLWIISDLIRSYPSLSILIYPYLQTSTGTHPMFPRRLRGNRRHLFFGGGGIRPTHVPWRNIFGFFQTMTTLFIYIYFLKWGTYDMMIKRTRIGLEDSFQKKLHWADS